MDQITLTEKKDIIKQMTGGSNVGVDYVANRIRYFAGLSSEEIGNIGYSCFHRLYKSKFFPDMLHLVGILLNNGFEVWVITASPEVLYGKFVQEVLGIPENRIIGVKSVIKEGITTTQMVHPIPQEEGKRHTIETFIKAKVLFSAGNSRGDLEMIESSIKMKMIVNPDDSKPREDLGGLTLFEYAKKNGWLIVRCNDVPDPDFPSVSSKKYNIRMNKVNKK